MAQIERRQKRIMRIRQKIWEDSGIRNEAQSSHLHVHHHIGVSENLHEDIGVFLRMRAGDPAVKVFLYIISWTLHIMILPLS